MFTAKTLPFTDMTREEAVARSETLKDILSQMIHETTRMSPMSLSIDYLCRIDGSLFAEAQRAIG